MNITIPDENQIKSKEFRKELESIINRYGYDNILNIPDFILVDYIISQLSVLNLTTRQNIKWHGWNTEIGGNLEIKRK